MSIEKVIAVVVFAILISFAGGTEFANVKHDAAQARLLNDVGKERAANVEQVLALNKLVYVWEHRAETCDAILTMPDKPEMKSVPAVPPAPPPRERPIATVPLLHGLLSLSLNRGIAE